MSVQKQSVPHFLIVGAQKSGTTSLADALGEHSGVFICEPREPEYFTHSNDDVLSWADYQGLFELAGEGVLCGEASTGTMTCRESLKEIKKRIPNVKLIAVLRDPAKRAFSGFVHSVKKGYLPLKDSESFFESELDVFLAGKECEFDWFTRSQYPQQLRPFLSEFGDSVHVVMFEELLSQPSQVLDEVQKFLGVQPEGISLTKENQTLIPKSGRAESILKMGRAFVGPVRSRIGEKGYRRFRESILKRLGKRPPRLNSVLEQRLWNEKFFQETKELEQLLGRKIQGWGPSDQEA